MHNIQELMHVHTAQQPNKKHSLMPVAIKPKFASTSKCTVPKFTSCELIYANFVSIDQIDDITPGHLLTGYG